MTVLDALKPKSREKGGAKSADQPTQESAASSNRSESGTAPAAEASSAQAIASSSSPAAETPAATAGDSTSRIKGPVEEVISKRARQLAKKIQRFKGYADSPNTLNADQKAAIATLPALEAVYNELQELIKPGGPVEVAELNEAARVRDLQKDQSVGSAEAAPRSSSSATPLADPLAHFLCLHALLHPARPSDHEHLTFGRLQLPANLQDEVQATDILRVGRMWEDLRAGGEAGASVLNGLTRGPTGDDEENDHIHHLLTIVAQSSPEPQAEELSSAQYDSQVVSAVETDAPVPAQAYQGPAGSTSAGVSEIMPGNSLNFLQRDEVNDSVRPELDADHSFEIIPPMEPHQTSGQQPPIVPAAEPVDQPAAGGDSFNWAEDEDEHHSAPVPAAADFQGDAAQIELAQPVEVDDQLQPPGDLAAADASADAAPLGLQEAQPTATAIMSGQVSGSQAAKKAGTSGQRKPRQPQQSQAKNLPRTLVDDDGFEMKIRNRAPSQQQQGSGRGGRGGRGGASGERGVRGGRGGQGASTRGGSNRGPRPAQVAADGSVEGSSAAPRPPRTNSQRGGRGGAKQGQAAQRITQGNAAAQPAAAVLET